MFNKSGVASKKSLLIGAQVIDAGYSGEVHIDLHNVGNADISIKPDDKVIQGIMLPIITPTPMKVNEDELYKDILSPSDRGAGGFGSTGN